MNIRGMAVRLHLLLSSLLGYIALCLAREEAKYPVVIIPGLAASVLDAKLDRKSAAEWYCTRKSDWRIVFLSFREALSPTCLCDELLIHTIPGEGSNTYANQAGVDIRPHDFGGLGGVAALDPSSAALTATYQPLISALKSVGYRERETLWAAPYDWRLAADGLEATGAAGDMQSLIEMAVHAASGRKAVIIAHSMGNLVLTYFMKLWGEEWVRAHIHHVVAASGPFGGAVGSVKAPVSGDNLSLHFPHNLLHSLQGVAPSGGWLFPSPQLWPPDEVIVRTNTEHYSAHDLERLLTDIGLKELSAAFPNIQALHDGLLDAGTVPVPLTCVYGTGKDTDTGYIYPVDSLQAATAPEPNAVHQADGDGTVNLRSLQACSGIGLKDTTATVTVADASHLGVLTTTSVLQALADVLEVPSMPQHTAAAALRGELRGGALTEGVLPDALSELQGEVVEGSAERGLLEMGGAVGEGTAVQRMRAAAKAVVAEGCAERRRLEGLQAAGGVMQAWEAAALTWHQYWHECEEAGSAAA